MKIHTTITMLIFFVVGLQPIYGSNSPDTLRFEGLLTKEILKDTNTNGTLLNDLDVTRNHHILLATDTQFYLLGWGGIQPLGGIFDGHINAFTINKEGFAVAIHNQDLCYLDNNDNLSKILTLPNTNMGVVAGDSLLYVYDKAPTSRCNFYVVFKGGRYIKLFTSPVPVTAATEVKGKLVFTTGTKVLSFNPVEGELQSMASLGNGNKIISLAYDKQNDIIFFSTQQSIFYIKNTKVYKLSDQYGGFLKFFQDGLIIFSPENNSMVRLVGISNQL